MSAKLFFEAIEAGRETDAMVGFNVVAKLFEPALEYISTEGFDRIYSSDAFFIIERLILIRTQLVMTPGYDFTKEKAAEFITFLENVSMFASGEYPVQLNILNLWSLFS